MAAGILALACLALFQACSGLGAWDLIARGHTTAQTGEETVDPLSTPDVTVCHKRMKISLNNLFESEALADFPLLVKLDSSHIDYSLCSPGGSDLRFKDSNLQALSYEIESWDASGDSYVWVKVPSISSVNDYIWLYYNSANPQNRSDPKSVWSNHYVGVWHGASTAESTGKLSSSSSGYATPTVEPGQIGSCLAFDGTSGQAVFSPAASPIADLGPLTVELWIKDEGSAAGQKLLSKGPLSLSVAGSGALQFSVTYSGSSLSASSPSILTDGLWVDLCLTWDGSTAASFYAHGTNQGAPVTAPSGARVSDADAGLILGNGSPASGGIEAEIDEIRLSDIVRSEAWMMAQYRSQSAETLSFGSAEDAP
jgi:hypothetical protein